MGVTYHIEGQNEKAVALFIKSNIPLGLRFGYISF
jgi:hypothetical protein